MATYSPATSFYPCPLRAADIFKPQPTPPRIYYLKDHPRVEYNDGDWPTTPEGEEEAHKGEVNGYNCMTAAGDASMMVRARPPLGLLSVKMREYREKVKSGGSGPEGEGMSKEGRFASPGMRSAPFPRIILTLVAEQPAKAGTPQGPPSALKYSNVLVDSNVKSPARKPLANANANANPGKKSKAASKPSRRRIQVVLTRATEEKENLPHASSGSEIDDPLHAHPVQKGPSKGQEQEPKLLFNNIHTLPDPFILTSSDECEDPLEGSETKGPIAGEPDKVNGVTKANSGPAPVTTAGSAGVGNAWTPRSCLRAANASPKGHTVSFKDPLLKFHFYYHPDPNDIWGQCGLSMRPTRKSFKYFLLILGTHLRATVKLQQ
jgi:hypothetical protein